jgi:hypothetical protein
VDTLVAFSLMKSLPTKLIAGSGAVVAALGIGAATLGPVVLASAHPADVHDAAPEHFSARPFAGLSAIGRTLDVRQAPAHLGVGPGKVVLTAARTAAMRTIGFIDGTVESVHGNVVVVKVRCGDTVEDVVINSTTVLKDGSTAVSLSSVKDGDQITAMGVKVSSTELDATSVELGVTCDPGGWKGGYGPGDGQDGHHHGGAPGSH